MNTTLTNCSFPISDFERTRKKVLNFSKRFGTFCFLDNNQYDFPPHTHDCLLALGVKRELSAQTGEALGKLQQFIDEKPSWLFGHLGYDLKNEIEDLVSSHPDPIGFPDLYFFEPEIIIRFSASQMEIYADGPAGIFRAIEEAEDEVDETNYSTDILTSGRFAREEYISIVEKLKRHIQRGDCYEINFCQEFGAGGVTIDPVQVYERLNMLSPNPFSALYCTGGKWLICASPERYLARKGNKLISQPIKGTIRRETKDEKLDNEYRDALSRSEKDRSENVMVVDLVRNDLARVCIEGSVKVEELFAVYAFPQVYQMISTITGTLESDISFSEIIRATFPMGSMTGAPKKRVMELIEKYEKTRRGIFSGAVGYIDPDGDFDFNVVIRSIMYNSIEKQISFQAGSGITFYSDAGKEWEECLLKAEAIRQVLGT